MDNHHRHLLMLTLFCMSLSFFRCWYTGTIYYLFLNWNLLLAMVPFYLIRILSNKNSGKVFYIKYVPLLFIWLLFFPNSPYILTDLLHIKGKSAMPGWFDLMLVLCYAWTALCYGFYALHVIQIRISDIWDEKTARYCSILLLTISSFGVYIGRYLRWNSWDVFRFPELLLQDIREMIYTDGGLNIRVMILIFTLSIFLNMVYWSMQYKFLPREIRQ